MKQENFYDGATMEKTLRTGTEKGLLYAFVLDGKGGAKAFDDVETAKKERGDGVLWLCWLKNAPETQEWIYKESGFDEQILDLLSNEDRPRCMAFGDTLLLLLRTVNMAAGADADEMFGVQIVAQKNLLVTVCDAPLKNTDDIARKLAAGRGPSDAAVLLDEICYAHLDAVMETLDGFDERLNVMEEEIVKNGETENYVSLLSEVRRALTEMRRYLSPQRYALDVLARQAMSWMGPENMYEYRENATLMARILDDIGTLRERALINIDELENKLREETQRNINGLSVLATLFIPATFVTGLLGINVNGIPFSDDPHGFWYITAFLTVLALIQLYIFKLLKWL